MTVKTGVSYIDLVNQINTELDTKQNKLSQANAGSNISITEDVDGNTRISVTSTTNHFYKTFSVSDFSEGQLVFKNGKVGNDTFAHELGSDIHVTYVQEKVEEGGIVKYKDVLVETETDESGNVYLYSSPFEGRIVISGLYFNSAYLEPQVQDILTGSVEG